MRRQLKVTWAWVRCWAHCLWYMWEGHCMFSGSDDHNRTKFIAAATGSLFNKTLQVKRVFYHEDPKGRDITTETQRSAKNSGGTYVTMSY